MDPNREYLWGELARLISCGFSTPLQMTGEEPQIIRELIPEAPFEWQSSLQQWADIWEESLQDKEGLSLAYSRLFLGPFEILASPYASFYLEPEQQLMGEISMWVEEQYAMAGLKPAPGPREIPDHVALELEFVYYLTYQYLKTGESDWLQQRDTFIQTHMKNWIPEFSNTIQKSGVHRLYDQTAKMLTLLLS
jgi:TorA maturation chaperone TorD